MMSDMYGLWPLLSTSTPSADTSAQLIPLHYEANDEDNGDDLELSRSSSLPSSIQVDPYVTLIITLNFLITIDLQCDIYYVLVLIPVALLYFSTETVSICTL